MKLSVLAITLAALAAIGIAQTRENANPGTGAHLPSQAVADVLKEHAGADGAFIAAQLVKENYQGENLASLMQYPSEEIVIVKLKGSEIRKAFERSIQLYPQPNASFLQLSGFTVEFIGTGDPAKRIQSISFDGGAFDENREYNIAMPSSLGTGGMGYWKIWDKNKIVKTLPGTVESVLKGKRYTATQPRWVLRS